MVAVVELLRDRPDFCPRLEREHVAPFVPLPLRIADSVGGVHRGELPLGRPGERLPDRPIYVGPASGW